MQMDIAKTLCKQRAIWVSRCCDGRAAISHLDITGKMASVLVISVQSGQNWPGAIWNRIDSVPTNFCVIAKKMQIDPYVCINAGLGNINDARDWVEYCNESRNTYWSSQRRKNGRDKPWGVKYWGLGNEIDGPWQLGHKNVEDYSKFALEAAKVMRRADSSIKLIASGSSNFGGGADWIGWNRTVLDHLKNDVDYISLHTYIGNRDNNFEKFLAASRNLDNRIEIVEGLIRAAQSGNNNPRPIYIALTSGMFGIAQSAVRNSTRDARG